ncbi:Ig-like domain-containing protein [Sporosarcina sp. GW1-11]|uniref:Ig-like domain-containing protein n=1 Tax=Sporosarcina sp. GW1-11 TaxID=2899126 RepID=UPI00294EEDE9|nr:Ig-like domain-containing protein [Sporosarcina sp. GW1-11]MDV6378206.1 Ig-like domain-containing protein [Sporosarcina sp. GW1-11]
MRRFVRQKSIVIFILLVSIVCMNSMIGAHHTVQAETDWKTLPDQNNVPINKEWIITFSEDVEISSITNTHIYVTDEVGQVVQTTAVLIDNGNKVRIQPPKEGYRPNASYTLFVAHEVSSAKRRLLSTPVKMKFHTSKQPDQSNVFVPREDREDTITYQERVTSLPNNIVQSLGDLNYERDRFVFKGLPDVLKKVTNGDIVIFPKTEQYPFGWSKEIVNVIYERNNTVLITKEPKLEDVIKDIDISSVLTITADDFKLDPEVYSNVSTVVNKGERRTFEVENPVDHSIGKIEIGSENGNPYVEYSDVQLIPEGKEFGAITLGGKIQLIKPVVNFDFKGFTLNWLEVDSGLKNEMNVEFELKSSKTVPLKIPLGVSIPIKAYGLAGAEIQFFISYGASGKIVIEFEIVGDSSYNLGVKKEGGDYARFNRSTSDLSVDFLSMKGEAEAQLGIGLNVNAEALQFTLGGIDVTGGYKVKTAGEIDKDRVCFSEKGEIYFESSARIGSKKNTFWDITYPFLTIPYRQRSTCSFEELIADPLVLAPGETAELGISGVDYKKEIHPLMLPDSNVKVKVEHLNVATVNYLGKVHARANAKTGDQTFITVTYNNDRDAIVKVIVPVRIADPAFLDEKKKMVESIGPAIRKVFETAEIVNDAYRDFSYIENDLKALVTPTYLEELRRYYEEWMHPTIDILLFAEPVSTALKFEIIESSSTRLVLKTVIPNRGLSSGANEIYTFVKVGQKWLLDAVDGESFVDSPINPSVDQIHEYLQTSYFEDARTEYISTGIERIYNQRTGSYDEWKYYLFTAQTLYDQYEVKFYAHDGSIVLNKK